jgi:hypothetical protein
MAGASITKPITYAKRRTNDEHAQSANRELRGLLAAECQAENSPYRQVAGACRIQARASRGRRIERARDSDASLFGTNRIGQVSHSKLEKPDRNRTVKNMRFVVRDGEKAILSFIYSGFEVVHPAGVEPTTF